MEHEFKFNEEAKEVEVTEQESSPTKPARPQRLNNVTMEGNTEEVKVEVPAPEADFPKSFEVTEDDEEDEEFFPRSTLIFPLLQQRFSHVIKREKPKVWGRETDDLTGEVFLPESFKVKDKDKVTGEVFYPGNFKVNDKDYLSEEVASPGSSKVEHKYEVTGKVSFPRSPKVTDDDDYTQDELCLPRRSVRSPLRPRKFDYFKVLWSTMTDAPYYSSEEKEKRSKVKENRSNGTEQKANRTSESADDDSCYLWDPVTLRSKARPIPFGKYNVQFHDACSDKMIETALAWKPESPDMVLPPWFFRNKTVETGAKLGFVMRSPQSGAGGDNTISAPAKPLSARRGP